MDLNKKLWTNSLMSLDKLNVLIQAKLWEEAAFGKALWKWINLKRKETSSTSFVNFGVI